MADRSRSHRMALRTSTRWKTLSFTRLPAEIRFMILDAIVQQRHPSWASFASICKEWQLFIERRNFCRLKLSVSCLDDFQRLVVRQRDLVQHILLDIELPAYSCRQCRSKRWPTNRRPRPRIGSTISDGIRRLFSILSTWKTTNGLTLELGAHSPTDSKHWFRNYLASDEEGSTIVQKTDYSWYDPLHGWVNGKQVQYPPESVIRRLLDTPHLSFPDKRALPHIESVTCLMIRREMRRSLPASSLNFLLYKLPRLERLILEPWRMWEAEWRMINDKNMADLILKPSTQTQENIDV